MSDDQVKKITEQQKKDSLPSGDELASKALNESKVDQLESGDDEVKESNQLAETLASLQNLVEGHAKQLSEIGDQLKHKRESLKSVFENDPALEEAKVKADEASSSLKERKSQLQSDSQVTALRVDIAELNEQKKEIEETLSNHLINYHQLTNSTSFDTSDGDQWDFSIRAKIKPRKVLKLED